MKLLVVAAILLSVATCLRASTDELPRKVDRLLTLIGEDSEFRDSARAALTRLVEEGKIPKAVAWEILKETSDREYLRELGKMYASRLSESELEEATTYLAVTANRTVYTGLIRAYAELDGTDLEARKKTLATRHPDAWKATEDFFRSETARKISRIKEDARPLKRQCSIDAFLVAQKSVRERLGIKDVSAPGQAASAK